MHIATHFAISYMSRDMVYLWLYLSRYMRGMGGPKRGEHLCTGGFQISDIHGKE